MGKVSNCKWNVFFLGLLTFLLSSSVLATNRSRIGLFYMGGQGGVSLLTAHGVFDNTVLMGASLEGNVGYKFTRHLRAGVSLDYTRNKFKNSRAYIGQIHALVNGYFDMPMGAAVPYIGLGIGYVNIRSGLPITGRAANNGLDGLGWKLGFGVNFRITDRLDLGVGYRLLATDISEINSYSATICNHALKASMSYYFGRR